MIKLKKILEDIRVDTSHYKYTHGKMPRGYGTWFFEIGKEEKDFSGQYSVALKKAKEYAKKKGETFIKVLT